MGKKLGKEVGKEMRMEVGKEVRMEVGKEASCQGRWIRTNLPSKFHERG